MDKNLKLLDDFLVFKQMKNVLKLWYFMGVGYSLSLAGSCVALDRFLIMPEMTNYCRYFKSKRHVVRRTSGLSFHFRTKRSVVRTQYVWVAVLAEERVDVAFIRRFLTVGAWCRPLF